MSLPAEFIYVIFTCPGTISITLDLFANIEVSDLFFRTVIHDRTWPVRRDKFSIEHPVGWQNTLKTIDPRYLKCWVNDKEVVFKNQFGTLNITRKPYRQLWNDKITILDQISTKLLAPFLSIDESHVVVKDEQIHSVNGVINIPGFKVEGKINVGNIKKLLQLMTYEEITVYQGSNRILFGGSIDGNIKSMASICVQI